MTSRAFRLAWLPLLGLGCTSVSETSPGVALAVTLAPPRTPAMHADGSRTITTDRGYEVVLTRAYLVSTGVEIFACSKVASGWTRWILGRAEAHELTTATRLGTTLVEPLTGSQESRALGQLTPVPDRYCRVSYSAGPADEDADGLPTDVPVTGNTLYIQGTFRRQAEGDVHPFSLSAQGSFSVDTDITPGALSLAAPEAGLVVNKEGEHWFDGVDFSGQSASVLARIVLENVRRSIRLEWK